jgi:hypothetical protein
LGAPRQSFVMFSSSRLLRLATAGPKIEVHFGPLGMKTSDICRSKSFGLGFHSRPSAKFWLHTLGFRQWTAACHPASPANPESRVDDGGQSCVIQKISPHSVAVGLRKTSRSKASTPAGPRRKTKPMHLFAQTTAAIGRALPSESWACIDTAVLPYQCPA